jgi:flagellar basal-body rod protein FlgB
MVPLIDTTMRVAEYAMRGLAQRADVRANNVANLNTPFFTASDVDFESTLQGALAGGAEATAIAAPAVTNGDGMPDAMGNTVDLETEVTGMMKDNLLRDAMVSAYNFKVGVLRSAIQGR